MAGGAADAGVAGGGAVIGTTEMDEKNWGGS